jgi:N-acylneuraminate cytidylyltransferase
MSALISPPESKAQERADQVGAVASARRVVAFIPVRAGSKSIPDKNIRPLSGKPLFRWCTESALECPGIDTVFVASDGEHIQNAARQVKNPKLSVIGRGAETATDEASTESALLEFAEENVFDVVMLIQATSPLLTAADLTEALKVYDGGRFDSLLSVVRQHRFRWRVTDAGAVTPQNYDPAERPRRQDWSGELVENGAFYITTRGALLESQCRLSGKVGHYEMAAETACEIDEPGDWLHLETLLRGRRARAAIDYQKLRVVIVDVDGVLTDAGMYYSPEGDALKKFNTRDGMGLRLLKDAGVRVVIMTGEDSPIVSRRAEKLGIDDVLLGVADKRSALEAFLTQHALTGDEVAYIGDDVNDVEAMRLAALVGCPSDACDAVRQIAQVVCERAGGAGCAREFAEHILAHRS